MRVFIVVAAGLVAAALASPAFAQGLNAGGLRPLRGIDAVETSPLQRLQPEARAWIAQERARQRTEPTELVELAVDIDSNIGEAIRKAARRERIGNGDLIMVVMYEIVAGAREDVAAELERLRAAQAPEAEIHKTAALMVSLDAKLAEVVEDQTVVSRSLVPQLAWSE